VLGLRGRNADAGLWFVLLGPTAPLLDDLPDGAFPRSVTAWAPVRW